MAPHWIVALAAILPLWLLQNVIHELAHGITMWIGWRWKFKIFPFPSTRLGRFTWAHVVYEPTSKSSDPSPAERALVSIMPKLVNVFFIFLVAIFSVPLYGVPIALALVLMFGIFNLVDFVAGFSSIFRDAPNTDIWRFQKGTGVPVSHLRIGGSLIALMLAFLVGIAVFAGVPFLL